LASAEYFFLRERSMMSRYIPSWMSSELFMDWIDATSFCRHSSYSLCMLNCYFLCYCMLSFVSLSLLSVYVF
jgi:hypothetical protein